MQEVSGSIPLTSTTFVAGFDVEFDVTFVLEKAVNGVKYSLVLMLFSNSSKLYRFKFQGPHRLEA